MQINGINNLHSAQGINQPHRAGAAANTQPNNATKFDTADSVEFSNAASFVSQAKELPEIRADRVADIREQIANGAYETDEKIDLALDALLAEIG